MKISIVVRSDLGLNKTKTHSVCTGNLFSQFSAAVVRHKANDGVVYRESRMRAERKKFSEE